MNKFYLYRLLFIGSFFLLPLQKLKAGCPFIVPQFTITQSHTCGVPRHVTLTNTSTGADSNTSKYYWYINNVIFDSSVGLVAKTRTLTAIGTYTIYLVAISPTDTCRDSVIHTMSVSTNKPRIYDDAFNLTYNPVWTSCITALGSNVDYTMQLGLEDTIYSFTIKWGDATADTSNTKLNPSTFISHTYTTLGDFTINIICTGGGCTDTLTGLVHNERIPSAGIIGPPVGFSAGCLPFRVRFVNSSYNTSGTTKFIWDWADGTFDTLAGSTFADTIYHTYQKGASIGGCNKTVTVTSQNNCGQSSASWSSVSLYDKDRAGITVADTVRCIPKLGSTFVFQNTSTLNCIPGNRAYFWDFGDGSTVGWIALKTPQTHTYAGPGRYRVMLIDSNGCGVDTFILFVYLTANPIAGMTLSGRLGCAPFTVSFTDTVTTNLLLRTRQWDFADTSNGQSRFDTSRTATHTFFRAGLYLVRLRVQNPCDTASASALVEVYEKPVAGITPFGNGCNPYTISTFNNASRYSPYAHFFWNFGDATTSTAVNPGPKTYPPGTFTVRLKIIDTCGTDSTFYTFTSFSTVLPSYFADTVCVNDSTHFNADSTRFPGPMVNDSILSYIFKDSATNFIYGSTKHLAYRFTSAGIKHVSLYVNTYGGCQQHITKDILVLERPLVSFTYAPFPNICDQTIISFTGNATTTAATVTGYQWDFGDGSFAFTKDTVHRYALPGSYPVKLTAFTNIGCPGTFTDTVKVRYNPKAKIKVTANCFGQITTLNDSSYVLGGDSIAAWAWDYTGDGTFDAFTRNTSYSYGAAGNYKTILRVTTNRGCIAYDTAQFVIDTLPLPSFTVDTTIRCMFLPFTFRNTSSNAVSYTWIWGDGTANSNVTSTAPILHTYTQPGSIQVKLIAFTANGCADSASISITVYPSPTAAFNVNDTARCAPFNFHFTNTSSNSNVYKWYVNGILISTANTLPDTLIPTANTTIQIRLVASNTNLCSSDSITKTIRTFVDPIANFNVFSADSCNPFTVHFTNSSVGATSYKWLFNDTGAVDTNTNTVHTFYNSSTKDSIYNVRLIAITINGCGDTMILPVHVRPRPTANFSISNTDSCGPFRVRFTNTSSPGDTESIYTMHFTWNFGNGITSTARDTIVQFIAASTKDTIYRIRLFAYSKHNCLDTISKTITVHPNAKANFTMSTSDSCGPLRVTFTNTSTPGNGLSINLMSFRWNFGNGIISQARDTSVTFVASTQRDTVYSIRLVSFSNYGCPDTMIKQVIVYSKPRVQFTRPDTASCGPATVAFTNTSFPNDTGSINGMTFSWNFGNGLTSTLRNPSTTFIAAKRNDTVYTITLIGYSAHGCPDTARSTYRVYPNPIDSFIPSATNACSPFVVSFNNQTLNGNTYYWNFGDGSTDTIKNPTHTFYGRFALDTIYTIKMVAHSIHGCLGDTFIRQVTVKGMPLADFAATNMNGCTTFGIQFLNNSQGANSSFWNFGDGINSTTINPFHSFINNTSRDTIFNVRLIIVSATGCRDTITKPVNIYPRPVANFTVDNNSGCGPLIVNFTNTSVNGNNLPITAMIFKWDFGNGIISTAKDTAINFVSAVPNDTIYHVKLISYSNHGCTDTIIKNITVHPKPKPDFNMSRSDSCGPFKVVFTNTSTPGNGLGINVMTFKWDFGNGIKSNTKDTSIVFTASSSKDSVYNIKLLAYSNYGCVDSIIKQVRVYPKPKSRYTMSDTVTCSGGTIAFTNTSYPNDTGNINIMSFYWDLGNGVITTSVSPTTTYQGALLQDTIFNIKLIAYSEHGCADTSFSTLRVHPKPLDSFAVIIPSSCKNAPVTFINKTKNGNTWFWNFGDGTTDTSQNPVHLFTNTTFGIIFYTVRLISISPYGCRGDTAFQAIQVRPVPRAAFATYPDSGCTPLRVQFLNMSIAANTYLWNFGDGTTSNQINPVHYYFNDSLYTVTLIATNSYGCDDTIINSLRVRTVPQIAVSINNPTGCNPLSVKFTNTTPGTGTYQWYFGDGYSDTAKSPLHIFINLTNDSVVFRPMLIAVNVYGCSDTAIYSITVYAKPKANFTYFQPVPCGNSRFQFNDFSVNAKSYLWDFGDLQTDTAKNPLHNFAGPPHGDTTYNVMLIITSPLGCMDTVIKTVSVRAIVTAKIGASPKIGCVPLSVSFTDSSSFSASVSWDFGDGSISNNQNPVHVYNVPGTYSITMIATGYNACKDSLKKINLITVVEVPKAGFIANPLVLTLPANTVTFTNTTINNIPVTWSWSFGDGATSVLKDPVHSYSDTGTYVVILRITNGTCSDTAFQIIRVKPRPPVANFTVNQDSGCAPLTLSFINTSTDALTYLWEFGDGETSTAKDPVHTYVIPGLYTVRLTATGLSGVDDTIVYNLILVYPQPVANFSGAPTHVFLPDADVYFYNLSRGGKTFRWTFTNNHDSIVISDTSANPKIHFVKEGLYEVKLVVTNEFGCEDSLDYIAYITVDASGGVYIPNIFSPNNDKLNDIFKPVGYGILEKDFLFRVYDRWGNLLYQSYDRDAGWDGTFNGLPSQMDVYIYIVEGKFVTQQSFIKKGTFHLVR
jgi:gliding motility-associated-like protein